jgi:Cu+-exporting ATPase
MLDVPTVSALPAVHTVELSISGMTCAACAARVEKKLVRIAPGVVAAVNFATERATVTAPEDVPVQTMIAAVQDAGYAAGPIEPAAAPPEVGDQAAYLRRRLILALVFFVPLSDLSITLSLFPAYRFTGWQWVLIALTAPVALWAAWPFHRAALKNARHGASSMDTLVSLGVVAACGWSVYAMFRPAGGGIYLEVAAAVTTFLLAGTTRPGRAVRRLARCASSPQRPPGTSASSAPTAKSVASRRASYGAGTPSWFARGRRSRPTARCCPASPRWTGA